MSPCLEAPLVRDAVADHVVDRGADGLRKAAVAEVRRNGVLHIDDVVVADPVQLVGADPGGHVLADHVEHVGRQAPGNAQLFLLFRGLDGAYLGGAQHAGVSRVPKALFRLEVHGIKRGLFWQRNPHAHHSTCDRVSESRLVARPDRHRDARRPQPDKELIHAQRVHATDAGSGCPFRTSDPLLEPEDGPVHLR